MLEGKVRELCRQVGERIEPDRERIREQTRERVEAPPRQAPPAEELTDDRHAEDTRLPEVATQGRPLAHDQAELRDRRRRLAAATTSGGTPGRPTGDRGERFLGEPRETPAPDAGARLTANPQKLGDLFRRSKVE